MPPGVFTSAWERLPSACKCSCNAIACYHIYIPSASFPYPKRLPKFEGDNLALLAGAWEWSVQGKGSKLSPLVMSFSSFTLLIPWSPLTEAAPTHLQWKQKLRETKPQCWSMGLVLDKAGASWHRGHSRTTAGSCRHQDTHSLHAAHAAKAPGSHPVLTSIFFWRSDMVPSADLVLQGQQAAAFFLASGSRQTLDSKHLQLFAKLSCCSGASSASLELRWRLRLYLWCLYCSRTLNCCTHAGKRIPDNQLQPRRASLCWLLQ